MRKSQHKNESPFEYVERLVSAMEWETGFILDQFKTLDCLLDYFDLWYDYDTEYWSGILECIAEGDDPKPALDFIKKYKLKELANDIKNAKQLATSKEN